MVCCLCANPPVTTWQGVVRVPGEGGAPKGGFPVLAEDLRPVSEVEARVNLQLAGGVRGQVAGSRQPGTGTGEVRSHLPSHPEVLGAQFASPARGLGIRQ